MFITNILSVPNYILRIYEIISLKAKDGTSLKLRRGVMIRNKKKMISNGL